VSADEGRLAVIEALDVERVGLRRAFEDWVHGQGRERVDELKAQLSAGVDERWSPLAWDASRSEHRGLACRPWGKVEIITIPEAEHDRTLPDDALARRSGRTSTRSRLTASAGARTRSVNVVSPTPGGLLTSGPTHAADCRASGAPSRLGLRCTVLSGRRDNRSLAYARWALLAGSGLPFVSRILSSLIVSSRVSSIHAQETARF
jgi:hypothetical protein